MAHPVSRWLWASCKTCCPGFDRINDVDLRQWLRRHGAPEDSIWSAPVKAVYHLAFAYAGGDPARPAIAAGAAAKLMILMTLFYQRAPLWRMSAGMGDTIFTPLYRVLEARGVKFKFFHYVKRLDLSPDGAAVQRIALYRQAEILTPPYRPLYTAARLECWPSEPDSGQLRGGSALRDRGIDFESVWCLTIKTTSAP